MRKPCGTSSIESLANQWPPQGRILLTRRMMLVKRRSSIRLCWSILPMLWASIASVKAQDAHFHNAPPETKEAKNPLAGQFSAATAGAALYATHCAGCHGQRAEGTGNVPALTEGTSQTVPEGEIFWFITTGEVASGMPAWAHLPEEQRWQIVTYLKTLSNGSTRPALGERPSRRPDTMALNAPAPPGSFADFRFEVPGKIHKITVADLPAPYATKTANNGPSLVDRPQHAWPHAPEGFKVELYASGLDNPRLIRTAPNGDYFLAESSSGTIKVFRGITADGKAQQTAIFATGLHRPYGIAFYPLGRNPKWVYIGDTDAVVRLAYQNGAMQAQGVAQRVTELPSGPGHWTRDIQFSADGKRLFVADGSASNADDPDTTPAEKNRADILTFTPDGSNMRVYAYGIRNPGGGIAVDPKTGVLWCSVNERDGLGDNLVPDYITHVQEGGFYGWPWWYMGGHQDPRHPGKHPELQSQVITPDVLIQPHHASLQMTFYEGKQFPDEYRGDIFSAQHGSWNKTVRTGYEVIRVPRHQSDRASGEYQDFLTGFVTDDGNVWGRPVGVTVATDGSLLVTDDGSNSIWRVSYVGKQSE